MGTGKQQFITDLRAGQSVEEIFLITRKNLAKTKAGKPYLALGLADKTGEIEARLWERAELFDSLCVEGNCLRIVGTGTEFNGQIQVNISTVEAVNEHEINLSDFMPSSPRDREEMKKELIQVIASIRDTGLRTLLETIFSGSTLTQFCLAPAAKRMHHAYLSGLLEHTLSIIGLAEKTSQHYTWLDRDLFLAGALLHDLAKITEFDFSTLPFTYTDQGRLIGHLVLGTEMVRTAAQDNHDLAPEKLDQLLHIILSHHGRLEYGSPVLPMIPEAILLHHLDDMDAKMNSMRSIRADIKESGSQWSGYQRHLERYLYLPELDPTAPVPGAAEVANPAHPPRQACPQGWPEEVPEESLPWSEEPPLPEPFKATPKRIRKKKSNKEATEKKLRSQEVDNRQQSLF